MSKGAGKEPGGRGPEALASVKSKQPEVKCVGEGEVGSEEGGRAHEQGSQATKFCKTPGGHCRGRLSAGHRAIAPDPDWEPDLQTQRRESDVHRAELRPGTGFPGWAPDSRGRSSGWGPITGSVDEQARCC